MAVMDWISISGFTDPPRPQEGYYTEVKRDDFLGIVTHYRHLPYRPVAGDEMAHLERIEIEHLLDAKAWEDRNETNRGSVVTGQMEIDGDVIAADLGVNAERAVDFSKLYTHPLARQFHEVIQAVDNLGCDSTTAINQLHALAKAVEQEINRLSSPPAVDVTDDMLNEGQERMCQMASRTVFEDHIQAEIYKAMRAVDPAFRKISANIDLALSFMDRCIHDGGFDREIGPIGCNLGDGCVCIGIYPLLSAART